ncbi:hypothetical protein BsWGS_16544 [Bradybaena similaris]
MLLPAGEYQLMLVPAGEFQASVLPPKGVSCAVTKQATTFYIQVSDWTVCTVGVGILSCKFYNPYSRALKSPAKLASAWHCSESNGTLINLTCQLHCKQP